MRQIGTLSSEQQATTFCDYLQTRGIKSTVDEETEEWILWILDEDQLDQAREELATFLENPDDPIYREMAKAARQIRKDTEKLNKKIQRHTATSRDRWDRPLASRCPVTFGLIMISLTVAVLTREPGGDLWDLGTKEEPLLTYLWITPTVVQGGEVMWMPGRGLRDVFEGQVWRLITPIFVHFTLLHIFFNMLWLRDLGTSVEYRRGSFRYLMMVLLIAAASNLAQYGINRLQGGGPFFGGMSGVVFGLFGYVWMKSRYEPESGFYIPPNTVFLMIAFFFICFTGAMGSIANAAHGVGLAVGMVLGYGPILWRKMRG